jgi:hypothetical protein
VKNVLHLSSQHRHSQNLNSNSTNYHSHKVQKSGRRRHCRSWRRRTTCRRTRGCAGIPQRADRRRSRIGSSLPICWTRQTAGWSYRNNRLLDGITSESPMWHIDVWRDDHLLNCSIIIIIVVAQYTQTNLSLKNWITIVKPVTPWTLYWNTTLNYNEALLNETFPGK